VILDTGLTLEGLVAGLALVLGAAATAALGQAAVAILVFGPRFWEAMTLPAVAAFVTMVAFVFTSSGPASPILSALIAGFLVAFLVAWLQRDSLEARSPAAKRTARRILIVGAILSWLLAGLAIGLVVSALVRSALPLAIFPLIGLLIATRPAALRSAVAPIDSADDGPSAGMLDE
jgi:hypothetical protein